jgi:oligoendopeptidase F
MYSDVLPDPDEFLQWTDTDDADKKIIENYEAVYARLEQLQNQLNASKIEYTYDKFTGVLEDSDAVTEQVQKHYEELLETYPQLTDAIKEMDAALIDESTGRLNAITQYANLVNIIDKINEVTKGQLSDEQYQLFLNNPQEFADWLMNPFENPDATPLTNAEVE